MATSAMSDLIWTLVATGVIVAAALIARHQHENERDTSAETTGPGAPDAFGP